MSIIQTMKHQESTSVYKPLPYLENVAVSASDRQKLCQWGFSVLDASKVDRHLATVAVTFFDRFLSRHGLRSVETCLAGERELQLAYVVSNYKLGQSCDLCLSPTLTISRDDDNISTDMHGGKA
jgi:hypothetical protein